MDEKIPADFGNEGDSVRDDEWAPYRSRAAYQNSEEREFDLRVRMCALDMAVQALPTLSSVADFESMKFETLRRAAAEFEKILRGETGP